MTRSLPIQRAAVECPLPTHTKAQPIGSHLLGHPCDRADPLGRLFTTPRQRAQIDDLRNAEPKDEEIKLSRDELFSKQEPQKQREQIRDPIVLKGVVKRKDGLSTAWINDGNTYLGDPALEYIQISPPRGDTGEVTIKIPTRDTAVDLKVGESYEPASDRVIDSVPDAAVEH